MSLNSFFSLKNVMDTFGLFYVNDYPFLMLAWNVFLAFTPFVFFLGLAAYWRQTKFKTISQKAIGSLIFFIWLIFFPNAAYLTVSSRHLLDFCPPYSPSSVCVSGAWEIMFFFLFSVLGWVFFVIYLQQMRNLLAEIFGKKIAQLAVPAIILLMSLGVLFGLTERFNSWEVFVRPLSILQNLLRYMTSWEYFRNWLAFAAGYYILYFFGVIIFKTKLEKK